MQICIAEIWQVDKLCGIICICMSLVSCAAACTAAAEAVCVLGWWLRTNNFSRLDVQLVRRGIIWVQYVHMALLRHMLIRSGVSRFMSRPHDVTRHELWHYRSESLPVINPPQSCSWALIVPFSCKTSVLPCCRFTLWIEWSWWKEIGINCDSLLQTLPLKISCSQFT